MINHEIGLAYLIILLFSAKGYAQSEPEIFSLDGVAIRGYDPVAFFSENDAIEGKKEFTFKWKDSEWRFASEENMKLFQGNPEKFAPQFGGYCAWGMREGYKADTNPKNAWTIHEGKLYLNYNKQVSKRWKEDKDSNIKIAEENWSKMTHN